ncbi:protein FAR1-RELATED SEQUENCE 5-like [Camellia sinensis]|uniref:protein FAR1-RELATED SEQUENCE 5-like n=1 Tax=Camellia sinensis TaxID=4442 RepID=UPI0010367A65|nr:protein FAR1-RELATED SEQUENCE 5-like [Camellia sinensis]
MDDLTIATQIDVHGEDDTQCKSILGMEFDSEQLAYEFYNSYEGRVGFSIRKEYAHKSKTGEITSRTFVCSKEGLRKSDKRDFAVRIPRAETRTGCDALMSIKLISGPGGVRSVLGKFIDEYEEEEEFFAA